jgi:hypothetical protein
MFPKYLANIASSRPVRECHNLAAAAFTVLCISRATNRNFRFNTYHPHSLELAHQLPLQLALASNFYD